MTRRSRESALDESPTSLEHTRRTFSLDVPPGRFPSRFATPDVLPLHCRVTWWSNVQGWRLNCAGGMGKCPRGFKSRVEMSVSRHRYRSQSHRQGTGDLLSKNAHHR